MKPLTRAPQAWKALSCAITICAAVAIILIFAGVSHAIEYGVDRPGRDYRSFNLSTPNPALCKNQCAAEGQCVAWTYVNPGVQGAQARCWLKSSVPPPVQNNCCASGVKQAATQKFNYPRSGAHRLDWCREWAQNCGKPAADAFCQGQGYAYATGFSQDPDIGIGQPTRIITSGQICNQGFCDGFRSITCAP